MLAQNLAELAPVRVEHPTSRVWFARFAAFVLVFLLFVIVFGAWVRITGSGAGCGDHWPTCHGELVPRSPNVQTLIEYTHRITSGTLGLFALGLPVWAFRIFPRRHPVRRFSVATFVLVLVEAGIGAGLVLGQLVAMNASGARAVAVAVHLTNTLALTACSALALAFARAEAGSAQASGRAPSVSSRARAGVDGWLLGALALGVVVVAASGAVTALGDTLFPVNAAAAALAPPEHFLVELRVIHPILACFIVCSAILLAVRLSRLPRCRFWALSLGGLSALQLVMGAVNIALGAPAWLQLGHLLGAQLAWLSVVLLARAWYGAEARPLAA
jgi:cytochrome c oxidase assembly protein subunit 15